MRVPPAIFLLLVVVLGVSCQDYQEVEERPSPIRPRQARGPIIGARGSPKNNLLAQKTSTTTTEAPVEDAEYEDELPEEEQPQATTTTEAPKKGIRGGVLRPFRSNEDLLEALKRRRQQQGIKSPTTSTTSGPSDESGGSPQSNGGGRRAGGKPASRFGGGRASQASTTTTSTEEPPQRSGRNFARGRRIY